MIDYWKSLDLSSFLLRLTSLLSLFIYRLIIKKFSLEVRNLIFLNYRKSISQCININVRVSSEISDFVSIFVIIETSKTNITKEERFLGHSLVIFCHPFRNVDITHHTKSGVLSSHTSFEWIVGNFLRVIR